jgi:hypothetical protein
MSRKFYRLEEIEMKELVSGDKFSIFDDGEYLGVFEALDKPYMGEDGFRIVEADTINIKEIDVTLSIPEEEIVMEVEDDN